MSNHKIRQSFEIAAEMHIVIRKDGKTSVKGPLANKALCMAILQDAANVINAYSPQSEADELNPAAGIIVQQPRIILPN